MRLATDAPPLLDGPILLAVAYRRPDEHDTGDHERHSEKRDDDDGGEGVHPLSLPDGCRPAETALPGDLASQTAVKCISEWYAAREAAGRAVTVVACRRFCWEA